MNYWYYAGFLLVFMIVYFAFLESRLFKRFGIQKWVIFEGKDSGMLTGKAYGLQQLVAGILLFSFSLPLFVFNFIGESILYTCSLVVIWPFSFITCYTGLIVLLRPHVFGEESRYHDVCNSITKDIWMKKIPISYTEILFANGRGLLTSTGIIGFIYMYNFVCKN